MPDNSKRTIDVEVPNPVPFCNHVNDEGLCCNFCSDAKKDAELQNKREAELATSQLQVQQEWDFITDNIGPPNEVACGTCSFCGKEPPEYLQCPKVLAAKARFWGSQQPTTPIPSSPTRPTTPIPSANILSDEAWPREDNDTWLASVEVPMPRKPPLSHQQLQDLTKSGEINGVAAVQLAQQEEKQRETGFTSHHPAAMARALYHLGWNQLYNLLEARGANPRGKRIVQAITLSGLLLELWVQQQEPQEQEQQQQQEQQEEEDELEECDEREDESDVYPVEYIIARKTERGIIKYLVKWQNYGWPAGTPKCIHS